MRSIALLVVLAAAGCNKEDPAPALATPLPRPVAEAKVVARAPLAAPPAAEPPSPALEKPATPDAPAPASAPRGSDATVDEIAKLAIAYLGHSMRTLSAIEAALDPKDCASGVRARTALAAEYDNSAAMFQAVKKARAAATEQQRSAADEKAVAVLGAQMQAMEAGSAARQASMRAFYKACPVESKALSRESDRFSGISDL